jgi:plasmid stabilization system protein ParE
VLYLASINPDIADRFIDASEESFEKLAAMPKMGLLQEFKPPELAGTRRWFVSGFDYLAVETAATAAKPASAGCQTFVDASPRRRTSSL